MPNPELISLITKAGKTVGSEYKLAKLLGVSQQQINSWKTGIRSCSPEDQARIAAFANEDALQQLVRATLEKTAGTLRGDQLKQVLGKLLQATGGVVHTVVLGLVSLIFLYQPTPAQAEPTLYDV